MTNQTDEIFSSLFDDELGGHDQKLMLEQLCKVKELKFRWDRYQLVSDLLQNNLPPSVDPTFSIGIMKAIDAEPPIIAFPQQTDKNADNRRSIFSPAIFAHPTGKRVAGFALAASVTVVALMGYQLNFQQQKSSDQIAGVTGPASTLISNANKFSVAQSNIQPQFVQMNPLSSEPSRQTSNGNLVTRPKMPSTGFVVSGSNVSPHNPKFNMQLHKYLINHNQHFSGTKLQGVMPYARIIVGPASGDPSVSSTFANNNKVQEKQ
jgi:negative regulator of sigma E activity